MGLVQKIKNKYVMLPVQFKASFWFLICAFLQKGIVSITTPIFTRLLSVEEYGQYSTFSSWMSIITCFLTLNIYGGVYAQGLIKYEERRNEYISSLQGLLFVLVAIWGIIYLPIKKQVNSFLEISTYQGILMLILIWTAGVYQLWAMEQRTLYKYKTLVIVSMVYSIGMPVLGIVFIENSTDRVTARILGMAVASLVMYVWMFLAHLIRGRVFFSWDIWKRTIRLAVPLIPHYLSSMILSSSDRIMINRIVGSRQAGIYSLAYSVSLIMTFFNTSLLATIEPWLYQKIKEKKYDLMSRIAYPCMIVIASVNLLLILLAPEVVRIFAPKEYYDAIWVIPPVAMSVYFMFLYSFFAVFEFYHEKTSYIAGATFVAAILNVLLNNIFIPQFGYLAAGYTTLVCYMIYTATHYCFMRKIGKQSMGGYRVYNIKMIMAITLSFMGAGFIFMLFYHSWKIRFGIIVIILIVSIRQRNRIKMLFEMLVKVKGNKKGEN